MHSKSPRHISHWYSMLKIYVMLYLMLKSILTGVYSVYWDPSFPLLPPTSSQKSNSREKEVSKGRLKDREMKVSGFLENELRCGLKSRKGSKLLETKRSWTQSYQKVFEVSFKYRTTVVNCAIKSQEEKIMDLAGRTWTISWNVASTFGSTTFAPSDKLDKLRVPWRENMIDTS